MMPELTAKTLMIAGSTIVVGASLLYFAFRSHEPKKNMPPNPQGVGFWEVFKIMTTPERTVQGLSDLIKKSGAPIIRFPLPFINIFFNGDPESLRLMVVGDRQQNFSEWDKPYSSLLAKFNDVTNGRPSLVTRSTYAESGKYAGHALLRKPLMHCLAPQALNTRKPIMQTCIEAMTTFLDSQLQRGETVDFPELMCQGLFDMLCSSMFDLDLGILTGKGRDVDMKGEEFLSRMRKMTDEFVQNFANPFRALYFWNKDVREVSAHKKFCRNFAKEAMDRYRARRSPEELEDDPSVVAGLLRAEYDSEEHRIADFLLFLLAGFDTSAYTLSWTLYELTQNPAAYAKAKEELRAANPGGGPATELPLSTFKYLSMCVKESSRKWQIAGVALHRQAAEDCTLAGYHIPKHSIMLNVVPHVLRAVFEDGDEFIPERWAPEHADYERANKYNFMFSQGKRNCIGQNLANMQVLYTLATFLQRYDFKLVSEVRPELATTFKPANLFFLISNSAGATAN